MNRYTTPALENLRAAILDGIPFGVERDRAIKRWEYVRAELVTWRAIAEARAGRDV